MQNRCLSSRFDSSEFDYLRRCLRALIDGEGDFYTVINLTPDQSIMAKIRFFEIQQDSIEWGMEHSIDGGKTWSIGECISAKRACLGNRPRTGKAQMAPCYSVAVLGQQG